MNTYSNQSQTPLTIEDFHKWIEALKNIEPHVSIEAFVITYIAPPGFGWKITREGVIYVLVNKVTWQEWINELDRLGLLKIQTPYGLLSQFSGIPVIENEELARELIDHWWRYMFWNSFAWDPGNPEGDYTTFRIVNNLLP